MSRTEKFLRNVAASGVLQVLNMIHGMITPRIMLAYYGSEMNGLVSSILQFISYFNIVEAGLSGAAIFALYKPLADKDNEKINGIITATKKMYYNAGMLFSVLVIILAGCYPLYVTANGMGYWDIAILVVVLGMTGIIEFFVMAKYTALLTADQKLYIISVANGFKVISTVILIYLLAVMHTNIILIYAGVVGIGIIKTLLVISYVNKNYKNIDYDSKNPDYDALQKRWDVLYLQILNIIQHGTPVVLLTLFCKDLKIVSVYVIYNMVIHGVTSVLGVFMNGLQAGFGELIVKNEIKRLQIAYSDFEFAYYHIIGIVYLVTFVLIQSFVNIYTSGINDTNYNLPYIGFLFVLNSFMFNLKTPPGMMVLSAGLYKETRIQTTIQGAIALILGIILVSDYGIEGVLIAAIASNIFRDLELPYFIAKNVTKLNPIGSYKQIMYICMMVFLGYWGGSHCVIKADNYYDWCLYAVIFLGVSITYFAIGACVMDMEKSKCAISRIRKRRKK